MTTAKTLDASFVELVSENVPDPRPFYAILRERAPVYQSPFGFWYVSRFDIGESISRDDESWTVNPVGGAHPHLDRFAFRTWHRTMLTIDGADHRRLRRLVSPVFNPRGARTLRDRVEASMESQFKSIAGRGEIDLVADFAKMLPTTVILDVLGLGHQHVAIFVEAADFLIAMHEPTASDATIDRADQVFSDAAELVLNLANERRASPRDDLLTQLVDVEVDGEHLSDDELVAMVLLLVIAGHETTAHTLGTGLYNLLRHPAQLQMLRDDRTLMSSAVEELLRYDAATRNSVGRYASRDIEVAGQQIRRGDRLFVGLHACNHDPAQFVDPLELDIRRTPNRHMAFNVGPHTCLGSSVARMELQIALDGLLDRFDSIELIDAEANWKQSFIIRGLESLPLLLHAS